MTEGQTDVCGKNHNSHTSSAYHIIYSYYNLHNMLTTIIIITLVVRERGNVTVQLYRNYCATVGTFVVVWSFCRSPSSIRVEILHWRRSRRTFYYIIIDVAPTHCCHFFPQPLVVLLTDFESGTVSKYERIAMVFIVSRRRGARRKRPRLFASTSRDSWLCPASCR